MINYILIFIFSFFILKLAENKVSFRNPDQDDVIFSAKKSKFVYVLVKNNKSLRFSSFLVISLSLCVLISPCSNFALHLMSAVAIFGAIVIYAACIGWEMCLDR